MTSNVELVNSKNLDQQTKNKVFGPNTDTYTIQFYDNGGPNGDVSELSNGNITFDAGEGRTWDFTFNNFNFPRSSGDFNHFGQLSLEESSDGLNWSEVSVSWLTDTNGHRAVSDRVSSAYSSGHWPTPGNVIPSYKLYASVFYQMPNSAPHIQINNRFVKFTYTHNVDSGSNANVSGFDGWDISLTSVATFDNTGTVDPGITIDIPSSDSLGAVQIPQNNIKFSDLYTIYNRKTHSNEKIRFSDFRSAHQFKVSGFNNKISITDDQKFNGVTGPYNELRTSIFTGTDKLTDDYDKDVPGQDLKTVTLNSGYRLFTDQGGTSDNYSDNEARYITYDAGANGNIYLKFKSFSFEASTNGTIHYDRLVITASNTIEGLNQESGNLSIDTAPQLSGHLYQTASPSPPTWGTSYVATNGGKGTGGGWLIPSNSNTDSKGNDNSNWVDNSTWYEIKTRYVRFWFVSDGSVTRPGWEIFVAPSVYFNVSSSDGLVPQNTINKPESPGVSSLNLIENKDVISINNLTRNKIWYPISLFKLKNRYDIGGGEYINEKDEGEIIFDAGAHISKTGVYRSNSFTIYINYNDFRRSLSSDGKIVMWSTLQIDKANAHSTQKFWESPEEQGTSIQWRPIQKNTMIDSRLLYLNLPITTKNYDFVNGDSYPNDASFNNIYIGPGNMLPAYNRDATRVISENLSTTTTTANQGQILAEFLGGNNGAWELRQRKIDGFLDSTDFRNQKWYAPLRYVRFKYIHNLNPFQSPPIDSTDFTEGEGFEIQVQLRKTIYEPGDVIMENFTHTELESGALVTRGFTAGNIWSGFKPGSVGPIYEYAVNTYNNNNHVLKNYEDDKIKAMRNEFPETVTGPERDLEGVTANTYFVEHQLKFTDAVSADLPKPNQTYRNNFIIFDAGEGNSWKIKTNFEDEDPAFEFPNHDEGKILWGQLRVRSSADVTGEFKDVEIEGLVNNPQWKDNVHPFEITGINNSQNQWTTPGNVFPAFPSYELLKSSGQTTSASYTDTYPNGQIATITLDSTYNRVQADNDNIYVLEQGIHLLLDSGGAAGGYSAGEDKHITFDAGARNEVLINIVSFNFSHTAFNLHDRLGIQASNTLADLGTLGTANLNSTISPHLSPYLYQSNNSSIFGNAYHPENGGYGASGGGYLFPSSHNSADPKGNTFPAELVGTWLRIAARYVKFYFRSNNDGIQGNGFEIQVAPRIYNDPVTTPQTTTIPDIFFVNERFIKFEYRNNGKYGDGNPLPDDAVAGLDYFRPDIDDSNNQKNLWLTSNRESIITFKGWLLLLTVVREGEPPGLDEVAKGATDRGPFINNIRKVLPLKMSSDFRGRIKNQPPQINIFPERILDPNFALTGITGNTWWSGSLVGISTGATGATGPNNTIIPIPQCAITRYKMPQSLARSGKINLPFPGDYKLQFSYRWLNAVPVWGDWTADGGAPSSPQYPLVNILSGKIIPGSESMGTFERIGQKKIDGTANEWTKIETTFTSGTSNDNAVYLKFFMDNSKINQGLTLQDENQFFTLGLKDFSLRQLSVDSTYVDDYNNINSIISTRNKGKLGLYLYPSTILSAIDPNETIFNFGPTGATNTNIGASDLYASYDNYNIISSSYLSDNSFARFLEIEPSGLTSGANNIQFVIPENIYQNTTNINNLRSNTINWDCTIDSYKPKIMLFQQEGLRMTKHRRILIRGERTNGEIVGMYTSSADATGNSIVNNNGTASIIDSIELGNDAVEIVENSFFYNPPFQAAAQGRGRGVPQYRYDIRPKIGVTGATGTPFIKPGTLRDVDFNILNTSGSTGPSYEFRVTLPIIQDVRLGKKWRMLNSGKQLGAGATAATGDTILLIFQSNVAIEDYPTVDFFSIDADNVETSITPPGSTGSTYYGPFFDALGNVELYAGDFTDSKQYWKKEFTLSNPPAGILSYRISGQDSIGNQTTITPAIPNTVGTGIIIIESPTVKVESNGQGGSPERKTFEPVHSSSSLSLDDAYITSNDTKDHFGWVEVLNSSQPIVNDYLIPSTIYRSTVGDPSNGHHNSFSMIKFKNSKNIRLYVKQCSEHSYDYISVYVDEKLKIMLDSSRPLLRGSLSTEEEGLELSDSDEGRGCLPSGTYTWYYIDIDSNSEVIIVFSKDGSVDTNSDRGYFYFTDN